MPQVSAPCVECGTEIRRRPGARGALPERCRDCYPKDRARRRDKRAVRYHRDPLYREKMLAKARRNRKPYRYLPAKPCRTPGCDQLARSAKHWYCEPHGLAAQAASSNGWRRRAPQKGSTTARGYGWEHQQRRARWKPRVEAGGVACGHCGQPIAPGSEWHLGHPEDDPSATPVPWHAPCNLKYAATVTARRGKRRAA